MNRVNFLHALAGNLGADRKSGARLFAVLARQNNAGKNTGAGFSGFAFSRLGFFNNLMHPHLCSGFNLVNNTLVDHKWKF